MRTTEFNYDLPPELIAQYPAKKRDASRLMVLRRSQQSIEHVFFADLIRFIKPDDLLIINDTKVLPARLWCRKESGARIELLFLQAVDSTSWTAIARPLRRLQEGTHLIPENVPHCRLIIRSIDYCERGKSVVVALEKLDAFQTMEEFLCFYGCMPLPSYIRRPAGREDTERYQTIYARVPGSVAAPTAGLHFTEELMGLIRKKGARIASLTLHVGLGTFKPVTAEDPHNHVMHEERFELPVMTVEEIVRTKRNGGRVIAVGTTVVRVLEHCALSGGIVASSGATRLFILPGFEFRIVDAIITNFHLPQSTLLMLVSAFASREFILRAYAEAVRERYRFFSYGDAMFIE